MSRPSTPPNDLLAITEWHPILEASNQVVLYNPTSRALSITPRASSVLAPFHHSPTPENLCPYCSQPLPSSPGPTAPPSRSQSRRAHNYFQLLADANEHFSRPPSPPSSPRLPTRNGDFTAEGYFAKFFKEECRLGMGANGSVFLCQHVLDGNPLGHFAVKKVAVGESHDYLLKILREVRLLEALRHENIITYHHAWLETAQFSSFGPPVPTLHILMQWAEGGSLDDLIDSRKGIASPTFQRQDVHSHQDTDQQSRSSRIRAFRARQSIPAEQKMAERDRMSKMAVHLLSGDEIKSLFEDVVAGLAFLHEKSILHLDLKPGNVLLTYDDGILIPRAMLSDFGTSQDMINPPRMRSGNTGTLEYTAPELLMHDPAGNFHTADSKADIWSLGMILHKLLFFRLPYTSPEHCELDVLEREILAYPGFHASAAVVASCKRRSLPRALPVLLETLLSINPSKRPSSERVLSVVKDGKLDPIIQDSSSHNDKVSLVRRPSPPKLPPRSPLSPTREATIIEHNSPRGSVTELVPDPDDLQYEVIDNKQSLPPRLSLPSPPRPPFSRFRQIYIIRGLKSGLLLIKVKPPQNFSFLTISTLTISPPPPQIISLVNLCTPSIPRPFVLCGILIPAIADLWTNSTRISIALAVGHIGALVALGGRSCIIY